MLLSDLLSKAAKEFPDKDAAVFPGERTSFRALDRAAGQIAARLHRRGVGPGKRVALVYENSLAALASFWGVQRAGAESVDVPTLVGVQTIRMALEECRADVLALDPRMSARLAQDNWRGAPPIVIGPKASASSADALGVREFHALEDICAEETPIVAPPRSVRASGVAMIVYTSGTTGRPKGVMLSHDNLISNALAYNSKIELGSDDSLLVVVPLYYIHGRIQLITHVMIGGTEYYSAGFLFPKTVLDELVKYGPTGFSGVPYHFMTLLQLTKMKTTPLPRLKNVMITGGALSPQALRELAEALPGVRIHLNYGQTESAPRLTYLGPSEVKERPTSCGRPLPGVTIEVLGGDGQPVPTGTTGEVVATSPGLMKGYVSGDERTSGRIDDRGRLRTGDIGRLDADGFLFLVGRSSEMIKSAGERIFPREIEDVLNAHPDVRESAVLGVPDPILGEKLVACIVPRDGVELAYPALKTHCLRSLPFVRTPKEARFVKELPKTAAGKIRRAELVALFRASP